MSPIGRWLLSNCDGILCIDLRMGSSLCGEMMSFGWHHSRVVTMAKILGLTVEV